MILRWFLYSLVSTILYFMRHNYLDWLKQQLPMWVHDGLITQDQAYQLSRFYQLRVDSAKQTVSVLLKMILWGLGIGIALFVMMLYWGHFSSQFRLVVTLLSLGSPLVWGVWALWDRLRS